MLQFTGVEEEVNGTSMWPYYERDGVSISGQILLALRVAPSSLIIFPLTKVFYFLFGDYFIKLIVFSLTTVRSQEDTFS